jgi:hypothetical protein
MKPIWGSKETNYFQLITVYVWSQKWNSRDKLMNAIYSGYSNMDFESSIEMHACIFSISWKIVVKQNRKYNLKLFEGNKQLILCRSNIVISQSTLDIKTLKKEKKNRQWRNDESIFSSMDEKHHLKLAEKTK